MQVIYIVIIIQKYIDQLMVLFLCLILIKIINYKEQNNIKHLLKYQNQYKEKLIS